MLHPTQIIDAPTHDRPLHDAKIFLAGATSGRHANWRNALIASLSALSLPITIYNPDNRVWDSSTWTNDISCVPFREQVEWELEKQEAADLTVVVFGEDTETPISLMELGMCVKEGPRGKIVVCPKGYTHRGNVQVVCARYGVELLDSEEKLVDSIVYWLENGYTDPSS